MALAALSVSAVAENYHTVALGALLGQTSNLLLESAMDFPKPGGLRLRIEVLEAQDYAGTGLFRTSKNDNNRQS
jgi:hypothetical protein